MAVAVKKNLSPEEPFDPFEVVPGPLEGRSSPEYLNLCKELVHALIGEMEPGDRGLAEHFLRTKNHLGFLSLLR